MTDKTVKLKKGKVVRGSVELAGAVVSVPEKTADKWIAAGEAEDVTGQSATAAPMQDVSSRRKRTPAEPEPDDAG